MKIDRKKYSIHRIFAHVFGILDLHSELQIDHIDRNPLNNCIFNLRAVTNQQNQFNKDAKGYCWNKNNSKWQSYIYLNHAPIHLGFFEKEEDARQAYLDAKKIYHVYT
jgi:hypothetical protein